MRTYHVLQWAMIVMVMIISVAACDDDDNKDDALQNGELIADNMDTPWEMAFTPDGRLLVTQRPGKISVVEGNSSRTWIALDSVVEEVGESGLFGIAVDPDFAQNGYVYICYTYAESKAPLKLVNKLVRYKENSRSSPPAFDKVLLDGVAGNYLHNMGALEFGPDKHLYVTVGEIFMPDLAQNMSSLNGKILRMTRDGEIPEDNPFEGSLIYSLGHRNPQGIAFHPETNALWSTEHGPSEEQGCCMDEINHIEAGKNYGWPIIRGYQEQAGLVPPVHISGDTVTWAPTGGFFVKTGDWRNSFVFTGLRGQALYRAVFTDGNSNEIERVERYFYRELGRLRNVTEGPDGRIYVAISNQDGRGKPDDTDDKIIAYTQEQMQQHETP
jgi:glucose/arabinose dehydrogenase